jgi:SAM-dependent methyltransferase
MKVLHRDDGVLQQFARFRARHRCGVAGLPACLPRGDPVSLLRVRMIRLSGQQKGNAMWDQRYGQPGYLFGTEPADFLKREAARIPAGARVLCVADGEGRNSVYLAGQGHQVTAFDASDVAVQKARKLAAERAATLDFLVSGVETWNWDQRHDAVVAVFVQFAPPDLRRRMFDWMARAVAPGGLLLLHGYAPRQVGYGTGGPPTADNMYTTEMLRKAFEGLDILRLEDYDAEIDEGPGHSGKSALIDLVARKPA